MARTTVGSERASVRVFPTFRTGNTWYFSAISFRTRRRTSGSTSIRERLMVGMPYLRLKKSRSCSSERTPSRFKTRLRSSFVFRCSATPRRSWSLVRRPSLTRRSPNRGFIDSYPPFGAAPSRRVPTCLRPLSRIGPRSQRQHPVHDLQKPVHPEPLLKEAHGGGARHPL